MQMSQLRPAAQLAQKFGVKCLAFGPPGSGKTPLVNTAPRPVMCATEPGMLSMRGSNVPTWEAYTQPRIAEFFKWLFESKEAANFDTVVIDSASQLAEIIITKELEENKDGRKAYGEMSRECMTYFNGLYFAPQKHVYLICKQAYIEENKVNKRKPYFPGQDLNVKVPHLYDEILHIDKALIPTISPTPITAIRCWPDFDVLARDRSGMLSQYEQPNLAELFKKCMQL